MRLYESLLRPLLFRLDPEKAHEMGISLIAHGRIPKLSFHDPRLEQTLFGVKFPNPVGLAAGFDKNAEAVSHWADFAFGFAELGTITRHPQPGNDKPRLFRLIKDKAIINRMGFNNDGADAIADRLQGVRSSVPIGINIGKSKITPLEEAADDYAYSFQRLLSFGDYFVVNVSSPNTPGLRSLQERGPLAEILWRLKEIDHDKPLFVKVSPDLSAGELDDVLEVTHTLGLTGIIATNTTISRDGLCADPGQVGGLSGLPLRKMSDDVLRYIATSCEPKMTLIGVGGIFSGEDVYRKISLGAHLCQIYTGWIYGGPGSISRILKEFVSIMDRDGAQDLAQIRRSAL